MHFNISASVIQEFKISSSSDISMLISFHTLSFWVVFSLISLKKLSRVSKFILLSSLLRSRLFITFQYSFGFLPFSVLIFFLDITVKLIYAKIHCALI